MKSMLCRLGIAINWMAIGFFICLGWLQPKLDNALTALDIANMTAKTDQVRIIQLVDRCSALQDELEKLQTVPKGASRSKAEVIDWVWKAIEAHQYWIDRNVTDPAITDIIGDSSFHFNWISVYKDVLYYLSEGN